MKYWLIQLKERSIPAIIMAGTITAELAKSTEMFIAWRAFFDSLSNAIYSYYGPIKWPEKFDVLNHHSLLCSSVVKFAVRYAILCYLYHNSLLKSQKRYLREFGPVNSWLSQVWISTSKTKIKNGGTYEEIWWSIWHVIHCNKGINK